MVGFQIFFFCNEFLGAWMPFWFHAIESSMDAVRGGIMLTQAFGIAVVFIDYVTRFDDIKHPWLRGFAVGLCMIGWLFQLFIYFLQSTYLV